MRNKSPSASQLAVLKAIHAEGPIARTELPKLTGLATGTISRITSDLVRRGFVMERKEDHRRSGRPRILLEIAGMGPIAVGASITIRDSLLTTFVDLSGQTRFEIEIGFDRRDTLEDLALNIADALTSAIEASGFSKARIEHVGVGMPAIVDSACGTVHFMTTFEQEPMPFAAYISERIGLPVTIEKNITCLARAEHWHGSAQTFDTFSLLQIGLSIDSAMYVDGSPHAGSHGFGPELGHTKTDHSADAEPCYCGSRGCGTAYVSVYALVRRAGLSDALPVSGEEIERFEKYFGQLIEEAVAGKPEAVSQFEVAGTHLGRLVADHINSVDPGHVLIFVPDNRYAALIDDTFRQALRSNAINRILNLTEIRFLEPDREWQSKGTAALAMEKS